MRSSTNVFVEHVTGIGYGLPTANAYLSTYKGALHYTPAVGDIAIWGAGQGGAGSNGHVALVTALTPQGAPLVTGTNWPEGSGAVTRQAGTAGMGLPTAYLTPSAVGGVSGGATGAPAAAATSPTATGAGSSFLAATPGTGWKVGPWQVLSGSALRRTGFTLAGLALVAVGLLLLLRRDVGATLAKVTP